MSDFDMLVISARQVWHTTTYTPTPSKMTEYVQTSGGRVLPGYEKGAKLAIDSLLKKDEILWILGHYFWSAEIEGDDDKRSFFGSYICGAINQQIDLSSKPDKWKAKTRRIIAPALIEARFLRPPDMSSTRPNLYTNEQKEQFSLVSQGNYHRDAREHWEWIADLLSEWERLALIPVCIWMQALKK